MFSFHDSWHCFASNKRIRKEKAQSAASHSRFLYCAKTKGWDKGTQQNPKSAWGSMKGAPPLDPHVKTVSCADRTRGVHGAKCLFQEAFDVELALLGSSSNRAQSRSKTLVNLLQFRARAVAYYVEKFHYCRMNLSMNQMAQLLTAFLYLHNIRMYMYMHKQSSNFD
jgi:hypothetical protein